MFCFQTAAGGAPVLTGNHWSKPVRAIRALNPSVKASASGRSLWRSGESSHLWRLASVSKRTMESQWSCTPGIGGSQRCPWKPGALD